MAHKPVANLFSPNLPDVSFRDIQAASERMEREARTFLAKQANAELDALVERNRRYMEAWAEERAAVLAERPVPPHTASDF